MASKREELHNMLSKRLVNRYGDRSLGASSIIEKEVNALLLNNSRKITQEELRHLERKVDRETQRDAQRAKEKLVSREKANNGDELENAPVPLDSYLVFNTAQEIQHQRDEKKAKQVKREKQITMKRQLDQQVEQAKNKGDIDQKIELDYANHCKKLHSDWVNDEKASRIKVKQKNMSIKKERDQQLKEIQERRERVRQRNRREEERLIQKAKSELEKEASRRRQQVLDQKAYMFKVQEENERQKLIRAERKRQEQEEDKRLQREYAARLDEQERIRKETFEKMKEKSSNNQKMYILATEEKTRQEREDEERAIMYQKMLIEEGERKAKREIERQNQNKRLMNQILAEQVEEFNSRKKGDQNAEKMFAVRYRADAQKAIADERQAALKRRQQAIKHKKDLEEQIIHKRNMPRDTDSATMTKYEKQINRMNLLALCKDQEVVEAVSEKLARQRATKEAKYNRKRVDDDFL